MILTLGLLIGNLAVGIKGLKGKIPKRIFEGKEPRIGREGELEREKIKKAKGAGEEPELELEEPELEEEEEEPEDEENSK